MTIIEESDLRFTFDDTWTPAKWDDAKAFKLGIGKLQGTKAVDIIVRGDRRLLLIEVKNFRNHRIENKARIADGALIQEVAEKIRDTVAGMIGAARKDDEDAKQIWRPSAKLFGAQNEVIVLLWLEEEFAPPRGDGRSDDRWKARVHALTQALKKNLSWLTTRVFIASTLVTPHLIPGVDVSPLKREP